MNFVKILIQTINDLKRQRYCTIVTQGEQTEENLVVERQQRVMEKFLTKKSLLVQKKETAIRHIRELGVLPEEAFEKYLNASTQKLLKSLHLVNETVKKYEHVNKKAFEQYSNFTKQREQLEARKEELDQSAKVWPS